MRAVDLSEAERRLWMGFSYGAHIDLRSKDAGQNDPADAKSWGPERCIRAEVIKDLLVGRPLVGRLPSDQPSVDQSSVARAPIDHQIDQQEEDDQRAGSSPSVFISGARIIGQLDLSGIDFEPPLLLQQCAFDEPLVIEDSMSRSVRLYRCHLPGVRGSWLKCAGDLHLRKCHIQGMVDLRGAYIRGQLVLSGSTLVNPAAVALCGDGLVVVGDLFCRDGAVVKGEVSLVAARIGGELRLTDSTLHNPGKVALNAERITVEKDVYCREKFTVDGEVSLRSGQIKGQLNFNDATLNCPAGVALRADHLVVGSHLYCQDRFTTHGEINLVAARIGGEVRFSAAKLLNPGRIALRANRMNVGDDMYCRKELTVEGKVSLREAHIKGQLNFNHAILNNPGKIALDADQLVVDSHLYCQDRFTVDGAISLVAARVGGEVRFSASKLSNIVMPADAPTQSSDSGPSDEDDSALPSLAGIALQAERLTVARDMYCRQGLQVWGQINLSGAQIGGQLNFNHAILNNPGKIALNADQLVVGGHLYCQDRFTADGAINLVSSSVGGEVRFSSATLRNPGGTALCADRLNVGSDMYCREKLNVEGEVSLRGAHIEGQLNFNNATLHNPEKVALNADQLVVDSHFYCQEEFTADGEVRLVAAQVGGDVRFSARTRLCNPTTPSNRNGIALRAERLNVAGDMYCREGLEVFGQVNLRGAKIGGQLNFNTSKLRNEDGIALQADHLVLGGHLYCHDAFEAVGEISLVAARVGGEVRFSASELSNPGKVALRADRLVVERDMYCRQGLKIKGEISLRGANVQGNLNCSTTTIENPGGVAIQADQLTVGKDLCCDEKFESDGLIDLTDVHVNGELSFSGATLRNAGSVAFLAPRLIVDKDMFCRDGFIAKGIICLIGAHIGGKVSFTGANLEGSILTNDQLSEIGILDMFTRGVRAIEPKPGNNEEEKPVSEGEKPEPEEKVVTGTSGLALVADGMRVETDMTCDAGFTAHGEIRLKGARIGRNLDFSDSEVNNEGGTALNAEDVQADRMLMPAKCRAGRISLRYGKMVELDDKRGVRPDQIDITGLSYETLIPPLDPETRLQWLAKNPYEPQPYDQLARSYQKLGHEDKARKVKLAEERRKRAALRWNRRIWGWLLDATIGYGYNPGRAAMLFAVVVLLGTGLFWLWRPTPTEAGHQFNPLFYMLDTLIPFADFGQRDYWSTVGSQELVRVILAIVGWTLAISAIAWLNRKLTRS